MKKVLKRFMGMAEIVNNEMGLILKGENSVYRLVIIKEESAAELSDNLKVGDIIAEKYRIPKELTRKKILRRVERLNCKIRNDNRVRARSNCHKATAKK